MSTSLIHRFDFRGQALCGSSNHEDGDAPASHDPAEVTCADCTRRRPTYYEQHNVGTAKYSVSYHDGVQTHKDGSPFYDLKIFRNRKLKEAFLRGLRARGYESERT